MRLLALVTLCAALPGWGDTQFRAREMEREDVPPGKGQCDIRVQIEGEAEVSVRGDLVYLRTISGRDGRDDGSECNQPLPLGPVHEFHFEGKDRGGDIRLIAEPSQRTDYQAVVRIRGSAGGGGRRHFRITWARPSEGRGGLAWNNTIHFSGRGAGSSVGGKGAQRLSDATVDIDRGGRILVSFRTDGRRPLNFTGAAVDSEAGGIRADVASDDRERLRGSMYLSRDSRGRIYRISLEATNGQERLRLEWNGR